MKEISNLYNVNDLPKQLTDIINNPENYNLENKRILSKDDILTANNDMQVDFVSKQLIPFVDCFDNDYICYDIKNAYWTMFNIVDEIQFKKSKDLNDLLNFKN